MDGEHKHTPLMQQYFDIKKEYPDALVFFQVGDFYELFFNDAQKAASLLSITLTARGKNKGEPIPLCGVPVHMVDHYIAKLVRQGLTVVVCDQLEEARPGIIVRRGVTRVLTPSTLTDDQLLHQHSASYLFSFYPGQKSWGLVFTELLTGQLFITTIPAQAHKGLESEIIRFFPDEVLIPKGSFDKDYAAYFKKMGYFTTSVDALEDKNESVVWCAKQFEGSILEHMHENESIQLAMHYFYAYMSKHHRKSLDVFNTVTFYNSDDFLILDSATQRNLELFKNSDDATACNTLFDIMNQAKTAMGSRMIKKWIQRPLVSKEPITARQDVVALLYKNLELCTIISQLLCGIGDIERVIGRISLDRASVNDYRCLMKSLSYLPLLITTLRGVKNSELVGIIFSNLDSFEQLQTMLSAALEMADSDGIIKNGYDQKLDQMRMIISKGNQLIIDMEKSEQQLTGIASLKIRYNSIQGYYIEITNTHLSSVPERYKRLQTLVAKERYMTPELYEIQREIEEAKRSIGMYEQELFKNIKRAVSRYIGGLKRCAYALAQLDALLSLASIAYNNNYVRPSFNDARDIVIKQGRHPIVEKLLQSSFITNDTYLTDEQSLWIITGPNMGGKSTYLRQVALMVIMAQIGSFVPASSACLPLVDRIFTRLGAADNISQGKSTFLIEMEETATICTQATARSLVILDEVGRGTSTFDGLAIAQAVVEYLFTSVRARCLFATHYHELVSLQNTHPGIVSYYAASKKTAQGIVFLYKMVCGVADGSFGIDVASLAELPDSIIVRARFLVKEFLMQSQVMVLPAQVAQIESKYDESKYHRLYNEHVALIGQLNALTAKIKKIEEIDIDTLSPRQAFDIVWDLKKE